MNRIYGLGVGADPEVPWICKNGMPQSVEGLLGGTKENPLPMVGLPDGFYVQEDNVMAEYNIPPAFSAREFSMNLAKGLKYIDSIAKKHGCRVACISAMDFPIEQVSTPHTIRMGCESDYNVWTGKQNPRPEPPKFMRTAGAHVHFSWNHPEEDQKIAFGKLFDVFLGVPSVLASEQNDRRKLYGVAGSIRFKYYGVECRILDNFWLDRRSYREHVFTMGQHIANVLNAAGSNFVEHVDNLSEEIQYCINHHDKELAIDLMAKLEAPAFPQLRG